jgi:hypothetical protein
VGQVAGLPASAESLVLDAHCSGDIGLGMVGKLGPSQQVVLRLWVLGVKIRGELLPVHQHSLGHGVLVCHVPSRRLVDG